MRAHAHLCVCARTRAHLHEITLPKFPHVPANTALTPSKTAGRRLQIKRSGVHGKGVFALQALRAGERLIEYTGEVIPWSEALRRHPHDPAHPTHTFYFHIDDGHVIDAKFGGNASRWINHSCAPNCEAEETPEGRVFIQALRDIAAGEELFYDYGLVIDEPHTPELLADYPCHCGAPHCRGTLLAPAPAPAQPPRARRAQRQPRP